MASNSSTVLHEQPFVSLLRQRCEQVLNFSEPNHNAQYCPGTFDGWACWPNTPAGSRAFVPCPYFITGFDPSRFGHKDCTENATWYRHPVSGKIWSNYSDCINLEDLVMRQKVNGIYETGYIVSLFALISSLAILSYFKSLRCPRITVHKNLFTSFGINNFLWLLWYQFVIPNPSVSFENGISCQILHVVLHYFLLSNYFWMLSEGLYLHTILVSAFFSEEKLVRCLYLVGWGLPLIIISLYTSLRIHVGDTDQCWINDTKFSTVLLLPVCFSMALNLFFLCNIVRVLLMKLRTAPGNSNNSRPSSQVLQGFRATLLLFPLLGVHYFLTPFRPEPGHPLEPAYEYTLAASASFQGLCVAILFCFCNGEVIAQMKRRWQYVTFRPRTNSYTATTVSFIRSTAGPLTCEDNV